MTSGVVLGTGDGLGTVPGVPYSVEPALLVCALIGVAAKEVSLGLHQVGGQPCTPDAVKVTQGGSHAGCTKTCNCTQHSADTAAHLCAGDPGSPGSLCVLQHKCCDLQSCLGEST